MASPKRDHLVQTALRLFAAEGFHAVGIDRILVEAGVAKMTLYKHFQAKDDLIAAALQLRAQQFTGWLLHRLENAADTPAQRLLAVFDIIREWHQGRGPEPRRFLGCPFQNAAAEFQPHDHPAHRAAAAMKLAVRATVLDLAKQAGLPAPDTLADQWLILIEGSSAVAHQLNDRTAATTAKSIAALLLSRAARDTP